AERSTDRRATAARAKSDRLVVIRQSFDLITHLPGLSLRRSRQTVSCLTRSKKILGCAQRFWLAQDVNMPVRQMNDLGSGFLNPWIRLTLNGHHSIVLPFEPERSAFL